MVYGAQVYLENAASGRFLITHNVQYGMPLAHHLEVAAHPVAVRRDLCAEAMSESDEGVAYSFITFVLYRIVCIPFHFRNSYVATEQQRAVGRGAGDFVPRRGHDEQRKAQGGGDRDVPVARRAVRETIFEFKGIL